MKPKEARFIAPKYMTEHYNVGMPCKFKGNVVGRVIHVDYEKCIITVELYNKDVYEEILKNRIKEGSVEVVMKGE